MRKSLKLKCIVTGKDSLFSGDYLKKKIEEYGDVESLEKLYVSRDVKTLLRRGYGINEIRNILNVSEDVNLPDKNIIDEVESKFKISGLKLPTFNDNLSGFTYNKSDKEVENFINNHII
jgi:hypothetical protein|tara:strand:+ start:48 stop:404 length:357 start_codon:yes stop_codon:yes gene_type:complete